MLRISGGQFRGQLLLAGNHRSIRPTSARTREVVFNLLDHRNWDACSSLIGAKVLDVCCGSGVLGLEALSRGADRCAFLDCSSGALALTRRNIDRLGISFQSLLLRGDATCPPRAAWANSLIFLDPPYHDDLTNSMLARLARRGWFAASAIIVIESSARKPYQERSGEYTVLDRRRCGEAKLEFLRYLSPACAEAAQKDAPSLPALRHSLPAREAVVAQN